MIEEYYLSYYDQRGRRHVSVYYTRIEEAEQHAKNLEEQGYRDIKIEKYRY